MAIKRVVVLITICLMIINSQPSLALATEGTILVINTLVSDGSVRVSGRIDGGQLNTTLTVLILYPNTDLNNIQSSNIVWVGQTIANTIDVQGNVLFAFDQFLMPVDAPSGTYTCVVSGEGVNSTSKTFDYSQSIVKYYVSPFGNDQNAGTVNSPFNTIQKAKETINLLKQQNSGYLQNDVTVYLRGGDYYLHDGSVVFSSSDSGNNGYTITYKNYPGETPNFIAGSKLENWTVDNGNIYKTQVPINKMFYTMYEDGKRAVTARHPNIGYNKAIKVTDSLEPSKISKRKFAFNTKDIPQITEQNDLEVSIWPGGDNGVWNWFEDYIGVLNADATRVDFDETESFDDSAKFPLDQNTVNSSEYIAINANFTLDGLDKVLELKGDGSTASSVFYLKRKTKPIKGDFEYETRIKRVGNTASGRSAFYLRNNQMLLVDSNLKSNGQNISVCTENIWYKVKFVLKYDEVQQRYTNYDIYVDDVKKGTDIALVEQLEFIDEFNIGTFSAPTLGTDPANKLYVDYYRIKGKYMQTIELSNNTRFTIGSGSRYYIQGAKDFLDEAGEFYIDKVNGWVYYIPYFALTSESYVYMPSGYNAFEFKGESENDCVQNIILNGLNISGTDRNRSGVYLNNAQNITVTRCKIHNTGFRGIDAYGKVQNCTFTANEISNIGETGIQLRGYPFTLKDVNNFNTVTNNHIFNIGQINGHGSGVNLSESNNNYIAYNNIHDSRRYGIALTANIAGMNTKIGQVIDGVTVTLDNIRDFTHTENNIIEYNEIYRCISDSQDCGPINTYGIDKGNVIQYNIVRDSDVPFSFATGIYLDDGSDLTTVKGNFIYNLNKNGNGSLISSLYVKGLGNNITNNIIANNNIDNSGVMIRTNAMGGLVNKDIISTRNVFINSGNNIYRFVNWQDDRFATSDYNIFYNAQTGTNSDSYLMTGEINSGANVFNLSEWKTLFNNKYDNNSLITDPLFIDEANNDYRLNYNSPAYGLGFEDINIQDIGLRVDYPFSNATDSLKSLFIRKQGQTVNTGSINLITGETTILELLARTMNGYIADLNNANVSFNSDNSNIVSVNNYGIVNAISEGIANVTATVIQNGVTIETNLHVIVRDKYIVTTAVFRKDTENGQIINNLAGAQGVYADIEIQNHLYSTVPIDLILVHYVNNKVYASTINQNLQLVPGKSNFLIGLTNQQLQVGSKVKLLGWNSISTLNPLFRTIDISY